MIDASLDDSKPSTSSSVTDDAQAFQKRLRTLNTTVIKLTRASTIDQLIHDAVKAGITNLGFDRMGIGVFDASETFFEGMYGTDERGNLQAEHHIRFPIKNEALMTAAIQNHSTIAHAEDVPLYNGQGEVVGKGWVALALLWDGTHALGWVSVDNLLHQRPLQSFDLDTLDLYGTSLGHLLALKRTEQNLFKERNLLQTIINTVTDFIYVKDAQSRFTLVNTASWKDGKRGRSEADMIGKTDFDFFPRELAQQYFDEEQELLRTGQPIINLLEPNVTTDSEPVVMLTSKLPLKNEEGEVIGLAGISRDVTNYVRAQQLVLANEARFDLITEMATASNIGVVMGDSRGSIHRANDAFLKLTGYERDDLSYLNLIAMTPPEYSGIDFQPSSEFMGGEVVTLEKELFRKDGSRIPVFQVGNLVKNSSKDFICFIIDLTLQRQIETERLEAALDKERAKMMAEFVSNLSHDLKTPLSIIQTSLHIIERIDDPAQQKSRLQIIRDQTLLLGKLIQSVLTMSRLDGDYTLSFDVLDLNHVMKDLERSMGPAFERKHQMVVLDLQAGTLPIRASESELYRVMVNLIENAINYTAEAGIITLKTYQAGNDAVVEVKDSGIGIAPEDLPHIFDRFVRGEAVRLVTKGTGLGLAIVKRIIELHHGQIEVESVLGEGTTFRVRLPFGTTSSEDSTPSP